MTFLLQLARRVLALPRALGNRDLWWLAFFAAMLVIGLVGFLKSRKTEYTLIPVKGGEITEGIVADSSSAIDREIETLTNAPLVKFDHQGKLQPALASSWEIMQEGRLYQFKLVDGFTSTQAAEVLKTQKNGLSQIEVATPDGKTLELKIKQPFAPLLADLTKPIFPVGFFEVNKRTADKIVLEARHSPLGDPLIQKIYVEIFSSTKALGDAIAQKRIDAAVTTTGRNKEYTNYELELPRYQVIFLNLNRALFKDKGIRQNLKTQAKLDGLNFALTTVHDPSFDETAQKFIDETSKRGAKIALTKVPAQKLEKEIIPNRDFDALLISVDLGRDPDSYSFWHSSQIEKGQNLSGFINKKADRILEDARLTSDQTKRKELYGQLQKILDDEVPAIFLDQEVVKYSVSKKVKGVVIDQGITPADRFGNIKDWYVKTKRVRK